MTTPAPSPDPINGPTPTSKSFIGVVVMVLGYLLQPSVLAVLPGKVSAIVAAIGALLAAFGFRQAITKNGPQA